MLVVTRRCPLRQVVDYRVVHEVDRHLQQQCWRAEGGRRVTGSVDGNDALFGKR